jgi:Tfp pilus assembly protein PilO
MTAAERILTMTSGRRQLLAIVILAAALALAWFAVLKPLHRLLTSQEAWRTEVQRDLARSRGKAAIESRLATQFESVQGAAVWKMFYAGPSDGEVGAQILKDVRGLGAASGIPPLALTPLPEKEYPDFIAHGVHVGALMTAEQLRRFGGALRSAPHYLRVERFAASSPQTQSAKENAPINVTLDIYGYSRVAAGDRDSRARLPARGGS